MTARSNMWSETIPGLQVAWDATSLKALMTCARYYQLWGVEGWKPKASSVHLYFGGYYASAVETYKKARLAGASKTDATLAAMRWAIENTWIGDERGNFGPWGGHYDEQWRCTGTELYRNARGNRAKCPWSKAHSWFPSPAPGTNCGECGSPLHSERQWVSDDPYKDRYTLARAIAWYCDDQPEDLAAGLSPIKFADGTPAVELSFVMPLPWQTPAGEPYLACGHIDSISAFGDEHLVTDNKTTMKTLGEHYWKQYKPNVQFSWYDMIGSVLYPDLGIRGIAVEAAQMLVSGVKFGLKVIYHTEAEREELWRDVEWYLRAAERYARENYWPMNRAACFACDFNGICNKSPEQREAYLEAGFEKREWNPTIPR